MRFKSTIIITIFFSLTMLSCWEDDEKGNLNLQQIATPTHLVTSGDDSGPGTLRDTIDSAPSGAVIGFDGVSIVSLSNSNIIVNKSITIYGGDNTMVTISGSNFSSFRINSGCNVVFANLRLTDGHRTGTGRGAAIVNDGTVLLQNCMIDNNSAYNAGAIDNRGVMNAYNCLFKDNYTSGNSGAVLVNYQTFNAVNCTFTGNYTTGGNRVGGVLYNSSGTASFSFCTVSSNSATGSGGAIYKDGGTLRIKNSIFSDNVTGDTSPNVYGTVDYLAHSLMDTDSGLTVTESANNILNQDPQLQPLADNGGLTMTFALASTSPARNSGYPTGCNGYTIIFDQREFTRPLGAGPDMGAFEYVE